MCIMPAKLPQWGHALTSKFEEAILTSQAFLSSFFSNLKCEKQEQETCSCTQFQKSLKEDCLLLKVHTRLINNSLGKSELKQSKLKLKD